MKPREYRMNKMQQGLNLKASTLKMRLKDLLMRKKQKC